MENVDGGTHDQAIRACQFWAGLEYMNLATAPDPDERRNVFRVRSDEELPWRMNARKPSFRGWGNRYKAQIAYCGLYSKRDYTASLWKALGCPPLDTKAMREAGDGAVLLIPLDDTGRVCGEFFISSMPWMMTRVREVLLPSRSRTVGAFFGFEEFMDSLMREVRELLVQMQLIREEDARERQPQGRDDADGDLQAGKLCGPRDMRPLQLSHVSELLKLIWRRSEWRPDWGPYRQPDTPSGASIQNSDHLARFKLVTLTKFKDRKIDLRTMNSMVAPDVERVRQLLCDGAVIGPALKQYLKLSPIPRRVDLRDGEPTGGLGLFTEGLNPTRLPFGAWPDFPLVTAQQFAVSTSRQHLVEGGLYGVNGPPGTGKSTLLRDVVADNIVTKAELLASYDDPLKAFPTAGDIEGHKYGYWTLDAALHGHGVVVASSNNGAVENVIVDLPKLSESMQAAGFSYFREVSDSVAAPAKAQQRTEGSTWGLVAALLGSSDKKRAFLSRFWFEATPAASEEADPLRLRSLRGIVESGEHDAPPWEEIRKAFKDQLGRCRQRAIDLEEYAKAHRQREALRAHIAADAEQLAAQRKDQEEEKAAEHQLSDIAAFASARLAAYRDTVSAQAAGTAANQSLQEARRATTPAAVRDASQTEEDAQREVEVSLRQTELILAAKPGLIESLLRWGAHRKWRNRLQGAGDSELAAQHRLAAAKSAVRAAESSADRCRIAEAQVSACVAQSEAAMAGMERAGLHRDVDGISEAELRRNADESAGRLKAIRGQLAATRAKLDKLQARLETLRVGLAKLERLLGDLESKLGGLPKSFLATIDLLQKSDEELQLCVAYNDPELRAMRVESFRLAMKLHEAFIVKAWKRLGRTLSVFVDYQSGKISAALATAAAPHLWNTFFLVVPVVSSTFASFDKLFSGLGREALGTLLIDEAGQSTPQNAVGAIWRSRRVIAVGDPLQLEPVVPQPVEALSAWREWVGADMAWAPPMCSTQKLADDVTPYGTTLEVGGTKANTIWVGSPLRVHRRCLNPMFQAANEIAYANLMVHDVIDDTAPDDWIGHSQWFDIQGAGTGHWVREQGAFAHDLILNLLDTARLGGTLKNHRDAFHINVITPYKDVADEFTVMLRSTFGHEEDLHKMSGTVHTFQGKEADVVILLLGGNPDKPGAISSFAGDEQSPNLLNVALTRAKKRLYVVGDKRLWTGNSATFRRLAQILDQHGLVTAARTSPNAAAAKTANASRVSSTNS